MNIKATIRSFKESEGKLAFLKALVVLAAAALLASCLVGCSSGAPSSPDASAASASSAAPTNDISVNVFLTEYVTQNDEQDTPLQFSDQQINVMIPEGSNAIEVLKATGREIKTVGTGDNEQVTSIGGLGNGDAGPNSLWVYEVNGTEQTESPATCIMENGETLTWKFVDQS